MTRAGFGPHNYKRQYRRRLWMNFLRIILLLIFISVVGILSYRSGTRDLRLQLTSLEQQIDILQSQHNADQKHIGDLTRRSDELTVERDSFQSQIPQGEQADLLQVIRERLSHGVLATRLGAILPLVENERDCDAITSRRFILPAPPLVRPSVTTVFFFGGVISVTGRGELFRNQQGQPESWFDPQQEVTMQLQEHGGGNTTIQGLLPLYQSVVIHDKEYRVTIAENEEFRSYVTVSADRCVFP